MCHILVYTGSACVNIEVIEKLACQTVRHQHIVQVLGYSLIFFWSGDVV